MVGLWADVFEEMYSVPPIDPEFDTAGWRSRTSSRPFNNEEMAEWLDGALERIRRLPRRRILEIGCGTGMLLWRLVGECDFYLGVDISESAVQRARTMAELKGASHVVVRCGEAVDASQFCGEVDLVLINSVSQYFPDEDYLERVLDGALSVLAPSGSIFVGDVRNADLLDGLLLGSVDQRGSVLAKRQSIRQALTQERELLLSPLWFAHYANERGLGLQAMPKTGRTANELANFRFDAILSRTGPADEITFRPWEGPAAARSALYSNHRVGFRSVPNPGVSDLANSAYHLLYGRCDRTDPSVYHGIRPAALAGEFQISLLGGADDGAYDLVVGPGAAQVRMPITLGVRRRLATVPGRSASNRHIEGKVAPAVGQRPAAVVPVTRLDGPLPRPTGLDALPAFAPPQTGAQRRLAAIWRRVLGIDSIGAHDSFTDLGGTPAFALEVVSKARADGLVVSVGCLLAGHTLSELVA
ncbi:methyltransferase domain-containing protein [Dactylosporangium sp. NPDC005572]|uniref:methyltransferase domain-containing protein n=1 Tax=Dactylosporangium sp. NPDC005572 TaxID=3156889 RepID=UPI0033B190DB